MDQKSERLLNILKELCAKQQKEISLLKFQIDVNHKISSFEHHSSSCSSNDLDISDSDSEITSKNQS